MFKVRIIYLWKGMVINMINFILMVVIGIMLFGAGIADIRCLRISRVFIAAFSIVCAITVFTTGESPDLMAALMGTLVGICAIGISIISDGQIGRGDGFVIAALGLALGFIGSLTVVCIASLIMCAAAVVMIILKKGNKKTRLPFIPALFAGYIIFMVNSVNISGAALL
jgi:leader peptidase (prepilin peptidase)/N-methyltransferase